MKTPAKFIISFLLMLFIAILSSSFLQKKPSAKKLILPYKEAGLTERAAAAHLLSRFTYGAKKGDVDKVVKMGLENWVEQQINGGLNDGRLNGLLSKFDGINFSNSEVEDRYPRAAKVLQMALKDGAIREDSVNRNDSKGYMKKLQGYMKSKGFKPQAELYREFISQKIIRAAYTENQLQELLTDFWFNHFNVSITKAQCAAYIPAFERDAIRPNVTGNFGELLLATAKSPAMLIYLDNYSSVGQPVALGVKANMQIKKSNGGLNENYAREVMELHTLGVDGGYTQNDVTEAARVLTGWTIAPMGTDGGYGAASKKILEKAGAENLQKLGFVREGDFLFVPSRHDNGEKFVLGKKFNGGGYDEGVALLNMLAHNPATAKFISKKIATRFVKDIPPQELVNKMAKTFTATGGNLREVINTMVSSPEFWSKEALRQKTKSPFELAISAVRSLDAELTQPYQLFTWMNKMGQKIYYYQVPTGFPDQGQYWINTGSLLNRMNFGLALASQRIPGIKINLKALNDNHEPESAEAALLTYGKMIMPERDLESTLKRLKPMLNDPQLDKKVKQAAERTPAAQTSSSITNKEAEMTANVEKKDRLTDGGNMLAQVVGVIIGSPEFQRK